MANDNKTDLDWNQALRHCIDNEEEALRVFLATSHETNIAISHTDNDSVLTYSGSISLKTTSEIASPCAGLSKFSLYVSGASEDLHATLEIAPHESDDFWVAIASISSTAPVASTQALGCRIRAKITAGSGTLYLVGSS